jgi:glucans biosynthesis protein C
MATITRREPPMFRTLPDRAADVAPTAAARPRRHDIDALRVLAFGLLILYHVGMFYVSEWEWHVKSAYLAEWLQLPMIFLNRWRMPLLFLLSGIAIGLFDPRRGPLRFFAERSTRLLLPLAFGMFVVVAVQAYCQGVSNGLVAPGFGAFLWRYWQAQPWPENAFDGWEHGLTWNHLWYLAYLWVYSCVLVLSLPLLHSRAGRRFQAWFAGLRGAPRVLLPALPLFAVFTTLGQWYPSTNALVDDWGNHGTYFIVFLYGYWIARDDGFWTSLAAARRRMLALMLATAAVYLPLLLVLDDDSAEAVLLLARALRIVYCWSALLTVLAWGHAWLNRPFRWLPYANEAVFPWYVLHQSLIVLLGYWLTPLALGPVLEPALLLLGTIGGCALLHEALIRRSALLRPLFGLKARARSAPAAPATATEGVRAAG